MAEKTVTMLVCDFPHKHDKPAVDKVTIDVCQQHHEMLTVQFTCDVCGRNGFKSKAGLNKHKTTEHNGKAKAA